MGSTPIDFVRLWKTLAFRGSGLGFLQKRLPVGSFRSPTGSRRAASCAVFEEKR